MAFQSDLQSQLKDPKQKRLLVIAVVFFAVALVIMYRIFFSSSAPSSGGETPSNGAPRASGESPAPASSRALSPVGAQAARESDIKRIRLDTDVVKTSIFNELRTYSKDNPVTVPEKGNPNPFQKGLPMSSATPSSSEVPMP